ncbi:MAG: hypothetical protein OEY62_05990, partial [Acidimicrobiia bacterium]|nr:hypothetical protein [Acidimicrobiia bacterium]
LATTILPSGTDEPAVNQVSTTTTLDPSATTTTEPGSTTTTTAAVLNGNGATAGGVAPWSAEPLPQAAIPQHLIEDWATAENQMWCSVLYPADPLELSAGGVSRSADFSGGWAVAWDLPDGPGRSRDSGYCPDCGRGAYGVAGADITGTINDLNIWVDRIAWDDGSRAGYGLEGLEQPGSGAPALSYLLVEGQGCLYNVWSFLGEEHLMTLLNSLRFVEGMQAEPVALVDPATIETREPGEAPWHRTGLASSKVPSVFFEEWAEDLGTTVCPMMGLADLGPEGEGATARRANGDSALIVAWDLPDGPGRYGSGDYCADCGRGAFGTSLWQHEGFYQQEWNPTLRFDDGSNVWVFPELSMDLPADRIVHLDPETGALAPEAYLALIEVAEHPGCLYRVWSSYGPDHVEYLVSQLRYIEN